MNILMMEAPTAEMDGSVPFGVLYAASAAYRSGHKVKILDLAKDGLDYSAIKKTVKDFSPDILGIGGITSCYRNCKDLTWRLKNDFKDIPVVAGGVLGSVSELLLKSAKVDFVVHGEGEVSFPNLIDALAHKKDLTKVKGISFLRNGSIHKTEDQPQIGNLDDIPIPEYSLLDMAANLQPAEQWVDVYFKSDKKEYKEMRERVSGKKLFPIMTARGCTHKCIFCYRHQKGLRQHSAGYVVDLMKRLSDRYGVGIFQINDELTTANKRWVMEFCDRLVGQRLNLFYIVLSSRVDMIDEEMLKALKRSGCLMVNYGYESASDIILKEIRKGVTREQALKAGLLTRKVGLKNVPEIMIGFPSETEETVAETIDFLKQLDTIPVSINTPIPFPETPLWDYGVEHRLIRDKEEFILNYRRKLFVNFTRYSDRKILRLADNVKYAVELNWYIKRKMYLASAKCLLKKVFFLYVRPYMPLRVYLPLKNLYRKSIGI